MKAIEIIKKKYGTKGFQPVWLTLDMKEIVWLMKEYHKQQLKILNIPVVSGSLPTDTEIQQWAKKEVARWEKDKSKAVAYTSHLIDGALWMRSRLVDNDRYAIYKVLAAGFIFNLIIH